MEEIQDGMAHRPVGEAGFGTSRLEWIAQRVT
jgi:hypothetical protein